MKKKKEAAIVFILLGIICLVLSLLFIEKEYTVSIDTRGGLGISNEVVKEGTTIGEIEIPTKEGYIFSHWISNGKKCNNDDKITKDLYLMAVWEGPVKYKVTFNVDGGSVIESVEIQHGNILVRPMNPTKEGYTFVEWQLDEVVFDFATKITKDIELKAVWKEEIKVTVTFNSNGGSKVASQVVKENENVKKPSNPTRSGYNFVEWQLDGKTYDFSTKVIKDIKLVAKWTKKEVSQDVKNKLLKIVGIDLNFEDVGGTNLENLFIFGKSKVLNEESMERKFLFVFYSAPREYFGEEYYDVLPNCEAGSGECTAIKISDFKTYAQKYGITDDTDKIVKEGRGYLLKYNNYYIFGEGGYGQEYTLKHGSLVYSYEGDSIILVSKISLYEVDTKKLKYKKQITYKFNKKNNDYYLYSFTNKAI